MSEHLMIYGTYDENSLERTWKEFSRFGRIIETHKEPNCKWLIITYEDRSSNRVAEGKFNQNLLDPINKSHLLQVNKISDEEKEHFLNNIREIMYQPSPFKKVDAHFTQILPAKPKLQKFFDVFLNL